MQSTSGIADIYLPTLERVCAELAELTHDRRLTRERCPACIYREAGLANNARYLLIELVEDRDFRSQLASGTGLSLAHFQLAWASSQTPEQRDQLLTVQLTSTPRLTGELREHARKQRAEARGEPVGREADSWLRAICLTAGWPAPVRSASLPEGENPYAAAAPAGTTQTAAKTPAANT